MPSQSIQNDTKTTHFSYQFGNSSSTHNVPQSGTIHFAIDGTLAILPNTIIITTRLTP
jgi:hypothetical protein